MNFPFLVGAPLQVEEEDENSNSNKKRTRPALTIKIQNSSFHDQENEDDLASELEKSPRLYISGECNDLIFQRVKL